MNRSLHSTFVLIFNLALLSSAAVFAQPSTPADETEAQLQQAWWHHPAKAEAFGLTPETRAQMDDVLRAHLESRWSRDDLRQMRLDVAEALVAGSWKQAETTSTNWTDSLVEQRRRETELKIQVAKLLTPEQRRDRPKSRVRNEAGGPRRN